jgi:hypothetical protein
MRSWQRLTPNSRAGLCTWLVQALLFLLVASASLLAEKHASTSPGADAYRVAGTVINASTGEPVSRAIVTLMSEEDNRTVSSAVSDAVGRFAFERVSAGKYPLTGSKRGFRTVFYDDHEGFNTAIVTGPDQDTTHLIFRLTPSAGLHGVVSGDGGDPVEGARVMLFLRPRSGRQDERMAEVDNASTDDTGAYEFRDLAPGDYQVAVMAEPWFALHANNRSSSAPPSNQNSALDVAYPITYFDSTTEEGSATPISLTNGSREEANISLHAVPALHLSVPSPRRVDGRLSRPELQQIVFGSPVRAESAGFIDALQSGMVEFNGVAPGHYELLAGDPPRIVELDATASQQIEANSGFATAAVTGTLRMADGAVPQEAHLFLQPQEGVQSHANLVAATHQGHFNFEAVASGTWMVMAEGDAKILPVLSIGAGATTHLGNQLTVLDRPLDLVVTIGEGASRIEGFARKDGKGFAGAMIELVPKELANLEALARRDQSDSDGSFSLRDVAQGQYTVVAIEDGWALDWTQPAVIARYLPKGTAVTVTGNSGAFVRLRGPVAVQPR